MLHRRKAFLLAVLVLCLLYSVILTVQVKLCLFHKALFLFLKWRMLYCHFFCFPVKLSLFDMPFVKNCFAILFKKVCVCVCATNLCYTVVLTRILAHETSSLTYSNDHKIFNLELLWGSLITVTSDPQLTGGET